MKFKLTEEQQAIIATDHNIKINAVAGSGKTSTLLEYAKTRPKHSRILYLVFNKSAKEDAALKFSKHKITNVNIQTAHSIAYGAIMMLPTYELNNKGYNTHETMVNLNITGEDRYIVANHVRKLISIYCNSECQHMHEIDYMQHLPADSEGEKVKKVLKNLDLIMVRAQELWDMMDEAKIPVTHEFYLKKYQLSNPILEYDYILFDEGQDASPVMLNVFLKQDSIKVIVGDQHQQIYAWRGAVNSLETVDFPRYTLSKSFRFGPTIARLAQDILDIRGEYPHIEGAAIHTSDIINSEAIISRSNICLFKEMISHIRLLEEGEYIFFEGNINSLLYTEEGTSIYDVLNLYQEKRAWIKSKFIGSFKSFVKLKKYVEEAEDIELRTMVILVEEYGPRIINIVKSIKENCTPDREEATLTFTTTHKSKGLEYDRVTLTEDFKTEAEEGRQLNPEEINILYVAATRAKKEIHIPPGNPFFGSYSDSPEKSWEELSNG